TLDERCYAELGRVLAPDHPYTVCAGTSLATDYALAGEHERAVELSRRMVDASRAIAGGGHEARDGAEHPYLLLRGINLSHDLRATGSRDADALSAEMLGGLRERRVRGTGGVVDGAQGRPGVRNADEGVHALEQSGQRPRVDPPGREVPPVVGRVAQFGQVEQGAELRVLELVHQRHGELGR